MRPCDIARPAAAGALCFAFTCAGVEAALAQTDTDSSTAEIDVHTRKLDVRAGKRAVVAGRIASARGGVAVTLEVRRDRRWTGIERDRTDAGGRFRLRERLRHTGSDRARVRVDGERGARPIGRLNVFRHAQASWYGPGLYGNRTGCGGTLSAGRLGFRGDGAILTTR